MRKSPPLIAYNRLVILFLSVILVTFQAESQAPINLRNTAVRPGIYTLKVTSGKLNGWVRIVFVN